MVEPSETELRLSEITVENTILKQQRQDADRLLHKLHGRLRQADRDKASLSWRLTRPMRWIQKKLHTSRRERSITSSPSPVLPTMDILFLIGCQQGESKRYRVENLVQGLTQLGWRASSLDISEAWRAKMDDTHPRVVVFFRTHQGLNADHFELIQHFRSTNSLIVFDIDDYIFDSSIIGGIAAVVHMTPEDRDAYCREVEGHRAMLDLCDMATAPTDYLVDRIRDLGKRAERVVNSVNLAQQARALAAIRAQPGGNDGTVRIAYFSGSHTHMRDFRACEDAILDVLRDHPEVHFRVVGYLDLDSKWDTVRERVEHLPFTPYLETLELLRECDVNIACLEEGMPFCEAKSELKFFESALVETPTIASRTSPYAAAIQDGVNGFLASSSDEWRTKLNALVHSQALRVRMGKSARQTALDHFTAKYAAEQALWAYGLTTAPLTPTMNGG